MIDSYVHASQEEGRENAKLIFLKDILKSISVALYRRKFCDARIIVVIILVLLIVKNELELLKCY